MTEFHGWLLGSLVVSAGYSICVFGAYFVFINRFRSVTAAQSVFEFQPVYHDT
jgi:hypothetical protein